MEFSGSLPPLPNVDSHDTSSRVEGAAARRATTAQVGLLLFIAAGALIGAFMYALLLRGSMTVQTMPNLQVSSIPRGTTSNGSFVLRFADIQDPSDAVVACNTTCLLGAFGTDATATCTDNQGSPYDLCRQVVERIVTWDGTTLLGRDVANGAQVCLAYSVMVTNFFVAALSAAAFLYCVMASERGVSGVQRNVSIYYPMFNVPQAVIAGVVLTFGSLFAMLISGPPVDRDLISDAVLTLALVFCSLLVERGFGHLLSIAHSPAFVRSKTHVPVAAHHTELPITMALYFAVALIAITRAIFRVLAAYNYGWTDPGVVAAYYGTVTFGAPSYAQGYALALMCIEVSYFVLPHLPMAAIVIEQMQTTNSAIFPRISDSIGVYRFSNLVALACIWCADILPIVMPPVVFGSGKEAACGITA